MPIICPYKDNTNLRKLPCNWHSHPQDANVRLCDCGNFYRIDELVNQSQGLQLILTLLAVIILVLGHAILYENPNRERQQNLPVYDESLPQ
jgi:hypothetical protein